MSQDKPIVSWLVITAIVIGGVWLFSGDNSSDNSDYEYGDSMYGEQDCSYLEPENPFSDGGHYAGFEWAQTNEVDSCGGNSDSFIEGCEEYLSQVEAYDECLSN
jgi:hypothetical protein